MMRPALRSQSGSNGRVNPANIGIFQMWQKQPDGWRLLARQAFILPS
jgi:hypothetical protein